MTIKSALKKYGINLIWHFTDKSNLDSIKEQGGILSLGELEERGIDIPTPGGNDWSHQADKSKKLHEYVHAAFLDDHPMLFRAKQDERIQEAIWLKIDTSILLNDAVRYCTDVSNKTGVEVITADEAVERIDFQVLFTRTDWTDQEIQQRRQAALKSEILIPTMIPIDMILGYKNG